jgi:hypothetical protein
MLTPMRPLRPSRPRHRSAGAALAVTVLALTGALAGCGGASTPHDTPKAPFGRSPNGPSDTPSAWPDATGTARTGKGPAGIPGTSGAASPSAAPTFALTDPPRRPGATPVTPSVSGDMHKCPTRKEPHRWCGSFHPVYPTVDPSAPCVDGDIGRRAGRTYLCAYGSWAEISGLPTPTAGK